ncbi:MAG: electron transfer flavoprotein subunit alpha/FixB family protein [Phycisphaerae bacterium]|nr:electron transfer flavoprotein subunit alpha/FixB family protein [Phycisphaerae bacterium]
MIDPNRQGEVWVFAEQEDGALSDVPLELLGRARVLADKLGVKVGTLLLGSGVESLSERLISGGADRVYVVDDPLLKQYQTNSYAKVVCGLIHKHAPQIVLYGASAMGRDLAPRCASACRCGLTADCTDLEIGSHEDRREKTTHENLLMQIRPAFGGNIIATIVNVKRWPQMATVREGVMPMEEPDPSRKGQVVKEPAGLDPTDLIMKVIERHRRPKTVNLKAARIIVAGGAGVGGKDNFRLIQDLANALGGAVGGSRAAVDSGFISHDHQVGQTGTTVRPALYIACGISGAVQHRAGMDQSAKIIAVNTDPDAPIFQIAHYGIVGDLNVVLPKMIKAVKARA